MLSKQLAASLLFGMTAVSQANIVPNDPYFSDQWALAKMNVPASWVYSVGSSNVKIAVLDTGIIFDTPDLKDKNMFPLVAATGLPDTNAVFAHGTWVASQIGMIINNNIGGAGTGEYSIQSIRITNALGVANDGRIIQGINLAAENNCRVINISFSAFSYSEINTAITQALADNAAAGRKDFLVFMSAGNDNTYRTLNSNDLNNAQSRPVADHLVMVGGTDENDLRWVSDPNFGSNVGPFLDMAAPAHHILVANGTDTALPYGFATGTSFSAPYAASAAALAFSINPDLTALQVQNILFDTAFNPNNPHPGTPFWDENFGWGRVDFAGVAAAAAATVPEPASAGLLAFGAVALLQRRRRS